MKVSEVDVVLIPSLPELTALPASGGDVPIYNGADNILYRIKAALLGGGSETALKWVVATTYAADEVVEFGLKLWLSLQDNNTGNTPVEGVWWTEVSKSTANGFGYYAPGVYTVDPSVVIRSGGLFWLDNTTVTFPFYSTDFEAEFAQNKWVQLTGSRGGVTAHNDLTGRDEDDSHPIVAITGLENRLTGIENQQSGNQLTFASIYGYYNFI